MDANVRSLLAETTVSVHPAEFAIISIEKDLWPGLVDTGIMKLGGPRPFMIFADPHEVTIVIGAEDLEKIGLAIGGSRSEREFRLLTFTTELDFTVVGFLAEVSRILAAADIPILALSSYSRDHLLIKERDLAKTLNALNGSVSDILEERDAAN